MHTSWATLVKTKNFVFYYHRGMLEIIEPFIWITLCLKDKLRFWEQETPWDAHISLSWTGNRQLIDHWILREWWWGFGKQSFISRRVGREFEPNTTPLKYYGVTKWLRALINLLQRINRNILFCPAFTMGKKIWIGDHFVSVIWIKWIKIINIWTWTSASLECLLGLTNSRSCSLSSRVLSATPREAYKRVYPTASSRFF